MSLFEEPADISPDPTAPIPVSELDTALTAQLVVAWAGESGEESRLGWWRSDLVSEWGGKDLFRQLLPATWRWAVLQGAREAARLKDAELRQRVDDPDRIVSLFSLGFALDEKLEERLQDLKRAGDAPEVALPGLADTLETQWSRDRFLDWVAGHGAPDYTAAPVGRRVKGDARVGLTALVRRLVAALAPLGAEYPLPHLRR